MLKLKNITKEYRISDNKVEALKGVSIEFRKSEFVSVLGPSGCGKTTLLNIIGGLDKYTDGDLVIRGKSTKEYKDADWDTYRNHTIGFVFQSYNLIPHQSVLSNVELALTLSGVSRAERRVRAKAALERVGLGDQLSKKPNQMSGGQMQRVAIARALVNNPDILLADEPTGALDSETSLQIMELLKEIAKDRLVVMVTHNPDLAEEYSTRIIKLLDGRVIDDSDPYNSEQEDVAKLEKTKHTSMSFLTALSLSLNNLMTKKGRTILTAFAGSIGIIGIALILALSNGVDAYINSVEEDTLSSYPIMIEQATTDVSSLTGTLMESNKGNADRDKNKIYSNNIMGEMMTTLVNGATANDLAAFKKYISENPEKISDYTTDIKYSYSTQLNVYTPTGVRVNPSEVFEKLGFASEGETANSGMMAFSNTEVWQELLDNDTLLHEQYELVKGKWPEKYNEVVLIVDKNNQISDYTLYSLGLLDSNELSKQMEAAMNGEKLPKPETKSYTYDELLDLSFRLVVNSDYFKKNDDGSYTDMRDDEIYMMSVIEKSEKVDVVGILRADSESASSVGGTIGYVGGLMTHLINEVNDSEIVKQQKANKEIDVITGLPFKTGDEAYTMADLESYIATLPAAEQQQIGGYIMGMKSQGMTDEQIVLKFSEYLEKTKSDSTYDGNLKLLGVSDLDVPSRISIFPKDFEAKEIISDAIEKYNSKVDESHKITYTDYIGLMLSSVTTIINAISYILIAFVSISLVVSSIMIGIITYISVLERTKEIGILRAMGASKKDISRVFNAETLIVGFTAGAIGILVTILLLIPINAIIAAITSIEGLALLPTAGAIILVVISMCLTFIAGLIPSKIAAKKDPVTALRTE
ncbi:MAG: ABC transporter ATP-binding protein/permease [Ruminococcaceae bacterium]|nr:ABC transporter ATP-binding protein/permease [Oscillospiraceae bacterium]